MAIHVHAEHGLMDEEEFAAFRENVFAIRRCASTLMDGLGQNAVPATTFPKHRPETAPPGL